MTATTYRGQSDVMKWCGGVTRAALSNWFARHDGYPEPDVIIANEGTDQVTRGWLPERRPAWEAFAAERGAAGKGQGSATKRARRAAELIYQGVQKGQIDPAEAVKLLHELI